MSAFMRACANQRTMVISNDDLLTVQNQLTDEQILLAVNGLDLTDYLDLLAGAQRLLDIQGKVRTNVGVQHSLRGSQHQVKTARNARSVV